MSDETPTVPSLDRAWELMDRAYPHDITVLGWADNMVMLEPPQVHPHSSLTFTVTDSIDGPVEQEDHVLVVAFRVPHPDEMPLDEVIGAGEETVTSDA